MSEIPEVTRYYAEPTFLVSNATTAPRLAITAHPEGMFVLYADHAKAIAALEADNAALREKVAKMEAVLKEARDFIAVVECEDGLTTANLCQSIDDAILASRAQGEKG